MDCAPSLEHFIADVNYPHALNYQAKYEFLENPFRL